MRPFGAVDSYDQMNALLNNDETTPSAAMKLLVDRHGAWAVLRALAAVLVRPQREVVQLDDLSPHMRRDMGLPPIPEARKYWEFR